MDGTENGEPIWTPLSSETVDRDVAGTVAELVDSFPDLPLAVHRIVETVSRDDAELRELVELVASDPPLVSNILKVVNSSYYGLNHKTDNLQLAVVLLGFNEIKKIATRSIYTWIMNEKNGKMMQSLRPLWEHCYLVSICAEIFADEDPQHQGDLMTLALLHDIGKFILVAAAPHLKQRSLIRNSAEMPKDCYLLEKEERLFGINHAIVGGILAKRWNFSERFVTVIERHHYPSFFGAKEVPDRYEREIAAVSIADYLVNHVYGDVTMLPQPHPHFFEVLGYEPDVRAMLDDRLVARLNHARRFVDELL